MASVKQLNKKIVSLKSTAKITKAMKMIAATKLSRAKNAAKASRPYSDKLQEMLLNLSASYSDGSPLFRPHRSVKTVYFALFTSDRGLCGSFNGNIIKRAQQFIRETKERGVEVKAAFAGKRGHDFFRKRGLEADRYLEGVLRQPSYAGISSFGDEIIARFMKEEIDEFHLVYNDFRSALTQEPVVKRLLPMAREDKRAAGDNLVYIFEPPPETLVDQITVRNVKAQIFNALLSSHAGEHAARMNAMENATKNGRDLIEKYTVRRNRVRQAKITTELIEIISGAESL